MKPDTQPTEPAKFEDLADEKSPGILLEFWDFLRFNRKWWLIPILIVVLILGTFIVLTSTPLAPFIYSLF